MRGDHQDRESGHRHRRPTVDQESRLDDGGGVEPVDDHPGIHDFEGRKQESDDRRGERGAEVQEAGELNAAHSVWNHAEGLQYDAGQQPERIVLVRTIEVKPDQQRQVEDEAYDDKSSQELAAALALALLQVSGRMHASRLRSRELMQAVPHALGRGNDALHWNNLPTSALNVA